MKRSIKKQYHTKKFCKKALSDKIRINMREFKEGRLMASKHKVKSRKQVLAISYSQIKKMYPRCLKHFSKKP